MTYYKSNFPSIEDIVFFRFSKTTAGDAIEVTLPEYNDHTALIMAGDVSKYKINPDKFFGTKLHPAVVQKIDEKAKHIDISYKRVNKTLIEQLLHNFSYVEKIHSLSHEIDKLYNKYLLENNNEDKNTYNKVCANTVWNIFANNNISTSKYENIYQSILDNPNILFSNNVDLESEFIKIFIDNINKRIKGTNIIIVKQFELRVFETNGIDKIKDILSKDLEVSNQIECVSSPIYKITVTHSDKTTAELLINNIVNTITKNSSKYNSNLVWSDTVIVKDKIYSLTSLKPV